MAALGVFGDWNTSGDDLEPLADLIGGVVVKGRGPDHGIIRDAKHVRTWRLKGAGSDHYGVIYSLIVDGVDVRVLAWNVYQGNQPDRVIRQLREWMAGYGRLDVIVLNEAYRLGPSLKELGFYRRYQGVNVGEGADVAVLVHKAHTVVADGTVSMRKPWMVVRYNRWRAARVYRRVRIRINGHGPTLRVLGIHAPTDAPINEPARTETARRINRWATPKEK